MTSLLLAIYCVSPATSSENVGHSSFLREAGDVQVPLHITQTYLFYYRLMLKTKGSLFFEKGAKYRTLPRSTT